MNTMEHSGLNEESEKTSLGMRRKIEHIDKFRVRQLDGQTAFSKSCQDRETVEHIQP